MSISHNKIIDYSQIKVIGFDLDQTLYPKSPEIDKEIQSYLYQKIAVHKKTDLVVAEKLFSELYQNGNGLSGRQTLEKLGLPGADSLVQEALENANIIDLINPNTDLNQLLIELKNNYKNLDIITGSNQIQVQKKLSKLEISKNLFNNIIDGDQTSKSTGSAYRLWLSLYPELLPKHFLYIGDRASTDYLRPKELGINAILVNIKKPDPSIPCQQLESFIELREYLI